MPKKAKERTITFPRALAPALLASGGAISVAGLWMLAGDYISAAAGGATAYSAGVALLVVAAIPLHLGELIRRGRWTATSAREATPDVATTRVRIRQLPWAITLAWLGLAVLAWVAMVLIPVAVIATAFPDAGQGFVWVIGSLSFLISSSVGVMVGSVIGRASHAYAKAHNLVAPEHRRKRWENVAGQTFPHLFLMVIGFASLGLTPVLWQLAFVEHRDLDVTALRVMLGIGLVCIAGGAVIASQLWRSGAGPGSLVNSGEGDVSLNFQS